jgi:thiol-disulfide isomerase/thioredoxin
MKKLNKILNILLVVLVAGYVIHYFYKRPKYDSGTEAKEFEAKLQSGENFKLSDLRGNYVLLDFWGSWCGPCRKENRELVPLYQEMQSKAFKNAGGFEILSVGLESKKESWEKAILNDGLTWKYHIGEFERFSGPIAKLYGIKEIPSKYFINPEGFIVLVNPSIDEVKSYLLEHVDQ